MWGLDHSGSVAEYAALAHAAIDDVLDRGRVAVVCGGSGLYLRAALAEMPLPPQVPPADRERFEQLYEREGAGAAHAALAAADARAAAAVHPHDRRRVVRALELHAAGSSLAPEHDRLWAADARRPTAIVGLDVPAELVSGRIARRTEAMFAAGVVAEVRAARAAHTFSATAERIHGLQDVTALLDGRIDQPEAQRRLNVRTRRYAKRQRTWMRRLPEVAMVAGRPRPARDRRRDRGGAVTGRREHDAVREARDALVIVAAAAPVTAAAAVLAGIAAGDVRGWAQWVIGPLVVAVLLLGTLGSALLLADRLGSRYLSARPHTISRLRLVAIALVAGLVLVAGLPTTWPVVIGFALVCALLVAAILLGALLGTH